MWEAVERLHSCCDIARVYFGARSSLVRDRVCEWVERWEWVLEYRDYSCRMDLRFWERTVVMIHTKTACCFASIIKLDDGGLLADIARGGVHMRTIALGPTDDRCVDLVSTLNSVKSVSKVIRSFSFLRWAVSLSKKLPDRCYSINIY
jgi:hypothetical protein